MNRLSFDSPVHLNATTNRLLKKAILILGDKGPKQTGLTLYLLFLERNH